MKDQVDEYKHAAEKLQKTENVMEKYKKKLEESADLRRRVKVITLLLTTPVTELVTRPWKIKMRH